MKLGTYKLSNKDFLRSYGPEDIENLDTSSRYDCDVLVWNNRYDFCSEMLVSFPRLKLFINWGTDDANLPDLDMLAKRVMVKKVDFYAQQSLCEYVLMLMVAFEHAQEKIFHDDADNFTMQIYGKKIGIIGLGKIGFNVASFLHKSFNCIIYYNTTKDYRIPDYQYASKDDLIRVCDYVIIVAKSRTCSVDPKVMEHANPDLVILNISRDSILPFKIICPYLQSGKIRGFIGDVTKLNPGDGVAKNILISPRIGYQTKEAVELKQNILLFYLKQYMFCEANKKSYVHIARHGKTEWNSLRIYQGTYDSPLTHNGKEDAEKIAESLADKKIVHVFTSPLGRAKRTAEIIVDKLNVPISTIPSFIEMNFGIFQQKPQEQIKELFDDFFTNRNNNAHYKLFVPYPSGESYFDVYQRILFDIMRILVTYDNFAIVGHESVNRMIRGIITGKNLTEMVNARQKNNELIAIELSENIESVIVV
ncbi:MAG: histidine phosphatase family protein [bacterium]|nr:histidine phosphatase family protein [bacterium]